MKKRSLIVILAVLCIATSCFVSSTFAKYTNTATGTDTATVAKWDIKQGDLSTGTTFTDTITFDLFAVSAIADTKDASEADDENVKNGTGTTAIIAPGTKGSFDLVISNNSEVTAEWTLGVALTGDAASQIVLSYAQDGSAITDLNKVQIAMGTTTTITVSWVWAFEDTTEPDNALSGSTVTATATLTVDQVD